MSIFYLWSNKNEDWMRGLDGNICSVTEEAAMYAIRNHNWTQVRFIPQERANTFEKERRAAIELEEELAASEYNRRLIETYAGGTNPND